MSGRRAWPELLLLLPAVLLTGCPEKTPPTAPASLTRTATSCSSVTLGWTPSTDAGGSGLKGYRIYRDGVLRKESIAPATTTTDVTSGSTAYTWAVSAFDNAGNESPRTTAASLTTPSCADTAAPSVPGGVVANAVGCTRIDVAWNASSDAGSGVRGYRVLRDGVFLREVAATGTSDTGVGASQVHAYTVAAVDNAGNVSAPSAGASAATGACGTAPRANAGPDQMTQTLIAVAFNALGSSDADGTITSYAWTFGDGASASGASVSHTYATAGTYTATLTVTDNAGLRASDTATISVANRAPIADAGAAPAPALTVSLSGVGSRDPDGTITSWQWAFGDGATGSGSTVSHTYAAHGTYDATLTVRDDKGAQSSDTVQVRTSGGALQWATSWGGDPWTADVSVKDVAVGPDGDPVVTGFFSGSMSLCGTLTSAGGNDVFVAKFDGTDGRCLWSRRIGGTSHDFGASVAVDGTNAVVVTGGFGGTVDLGAGPVASAGSYDVFVTKLSASGAPLWARRAGGTLDDSGAGIALDGAGNVYLAASFNGTADFGGGVVTSAGAGDVAIAKYAGANGAYQWSKRFGGAGADRPTGIAADAAGRIDVTGVFAGSASFGGATLASAGGNDVFVAQYQAASGAHVWSKRFGGTGDDYGNDVAVDAAGGLVVTGQFVTSIDLGGGVLTNANAPDIFVGALSSGGAHVWSKAFGKPSGFNEVSTGVATDASGHVLLGANVIDAVDFGGGALPMSGGYDPVVVELGAGGSHRWSKRFASLSSTYNYHGPVAVDAAGNVFATGSFSGLMDVGVTLANAGGLVGKSTDGFLVKLGP
jgi:PKD repeat protein